MPIQIQSLDHLVLTVADISATAEFYERVLGFVAEQFNPADGTDRVALCFGNQKINLHQAGAEFEPKAHLAKPGTADLCFLAETSIEDCITHLREEGVEILEGPVAKTGATGPLLSIYIRDPDENLIEISNLKT